MTGFIKLVLVAFFNQLDNFCIKIDGYVKVLGLDPAKVTSIKADRDFLKWALQNKQAYIDYARAWTKYLNQLFKGNGKQPLGAPPALPTFGAMPPIVLADIYSRFSDIAADCKNSNAFTDAIGKDLEIIAINSAFDPQDGKPNLKVTLQAGKPYLKYKKGKFKGIAIYKQTDPSKEFEKLDSSPFATYTDNADLPAIGKSEIWTYKAIYLYNGEEVGDYSDAVSILVKGI